MASLWVPQATKVGVVACSRVESCVAISKQLLSPSLHHVLCLHLQGRRVTQHTVLGSTVAFCCAP